MDIHIVIVLWTQYPNVPAGVTQWQREWGKVLSSEWDRKWRYDTIKDEKLLEKILSGKSDADIPFVGMCDLLIKLGFKEHIRGDHHIFLKEGIRGLINLQPEGSKGKAYQVRQVRKIIINYKL